MADRNTPTPWTLQAPYLGSYRITAMQGPIKVSPCVASSLDDADLIVRAVNAHDELVAAADDALNCLIGCCVSAGGCDDRKTILDTQMRLRKILAEVGVTYSEAL